MVFGLRPGFKLNYSAIRAALEKGACNIGGERRWPALAVGQLRLTLVRLALHPILLRLD